MSRLHIESIPKAPGQRLSFSPPSPQAHASIRRRSLALLTVAVAIFVLAVLSRVAHGQEAAAIGRIGHVAGEVTLLRGAHSLPATTGTVVYEEDALATGPDGRAELVCADGSTVVLGSDTAVSIATFAPPTAGPGRALLDLIDGILRLTLSAGRTWQSFEVRSATAVASVRSTDWIMDAHRATTAVFVVDGRVAVDSRAGLGGIVLAAGQGTDVRAGEAPTAPKNWGQKRIDDVLARTSLP